MKLELSDILFRITMPVLMGIIGFIGIAAIGMAFLFDKARLFKRLLRTDIK